MSNDKTRVLALNDAKVVKQARLERRKAIARRAWEGGHALLSEIAKAAKATTPTVRKWAKDGKWSGGPLTGTVGSEP